MLLDISPALRSPGVSFPFAGTDDLGQMCAAGEEIRFLKPVQTEGSFVFTGDNMLLRGSIKADYAAFCYRCLKEVQSQMILPFDEEFSKEQDENHPDMYLYRGEQIDLGQMLSELISLNTPMRHLCSDACRGLCPVCGADRNTTDCRCSDAGADEETE